MSSNKPKLLVRSLHPMDRHQLLAFDEPNWNNFESFLGPNRFVSILSESTSNKILGWQVTYPTPKGFRSKVVLDDKYNKRKYFDFLMKPTLARHGVQEFDEQLQDRKFQDD